MNLDFSDFIKFRNFIFDKTGLFFEEKKIYFVKKRIAKRMEELGIESPIEYLKYLKFLDKNGEELEKFVNLLTTNETYFFREFEQLQAFAEHCLPEIEEKKKKTGDTTLRILSAGCSTGEEPYTLSIIAMEMLDNYREWNIDIIGIDIDTNALEKAKQGIYSNRSVKDVPREYYEKYFETNGENHKVKYIVKKNVSFFRVNLTDRETLLRLGNFDFIFCRNVLIYFNDASRKMVVNTFYELLNPGGYIFLGHSESISRISSAFSIKKKGGMIVYQKPE